MLVLASKGGGEHVAKVTFGIMNMLFSPILGAQFSRTGRNSAQGRKPALENRTQIVAAIKRK